MQRSKGMAEVRPRKTDDFTSAGCAVVLANALLFASEPLQQACVMLGKMELGTNSSILNGYLYMATLLLQSVLDSVAATCQKVSPVDGCGDVYFCSYSFFKSDVVWLSAHQREIGGLKWKGSSFNQLANALKHEQAWVGCVSAPCELGVRDVYDEEGTGFVYSILVPVYKQANLHAEVVRINNGLPEPAGGAAPEPAGGAAPEPAGGAAPEPAGGAAPEPAGGAAPEPAGGAVPEPAGGAVPEPAGGAVPEPAGGAVPEPDLAPLVIVRMYMRSAFCQAAIGGVSGQVEPLIGWISKAKVEASLLLARDITEQLRAGVAVSDLYNQTQTWWKHRISSAVPGTDRPKGALWNQVLNYAATEFETMVCNNAWVPLFPRLGRLCKTWLSHLCPSLKKLVKAVRDHAEEQLPWDFDFWLPELQQFVREEVERLQHVPGQLQQMEERAEELWSHLSSSVPKKAYHVLEEIRCASPAGEQHSGKPEWHREVQRFVVEVRRQLRARADQALFDDHGAKQMSFPEVLRFNFWMQQQFIELRTKRMKLMPTYQVKRHNIRLDRQALMILAKQVLANHASVQHLMEMEKENNRFQSHAAKQAPAAAERAQEEASDDEEDAASAASAGPSTSAGSGPSSRKPAINRRDPKKMLPRTIKRKECASVEEFKAKQLERQAKVERIKKLPEFTDREQQYAALKKQEDTVMELLFDKRVLSLRSGSGLLFDFSLVTDGVAASLQYQRPKSASLNSSTDRARGRAKVLKKPKAKGAGKKGAAGQRKKSAPQPGADAPTTEEEWDRHLDCFDEASNLLTLGADPGRRFLVTVGLVTAYALSADGKRLECKDKQRRYTWSLSRAQYRHESGVRRQDLLKAQRYSGLQQFFADLCQPETALRTDDPNTIQAYMQAVAPRRAEWWSLALQKVESEAAFARYRGKRSVLDRFWARVRRDVARLLPRGDAQPRVELAYGSCGVTMKSGGRGEVSVPVAGTYKACVRAFGGANVRASPLKKTSVQVTTEFRSTMVSWETGMVKRLVYRVVEPKATAAPDPSQQRPVATARQREALREQLRQLRQQRHTSSRLSAAARLRAASAAAPGVEQEGALPGCGGARPRFQRCSVTSALHFSVRVARPGAKQPPVVIDPAHLAAQRRFKELEEHRENSRRGGAAARDGDEWQGEGGHEGVERYSEVRGLRFDPGTRMFRLRDADAATTIARFRIMQRQGKELPKPFRPKTELEYGPE
ncbi:hypothetical protein HXX76_014027 [Chlamydomonas incerta]|uniref:Uncharacterized protein n=1 Tax=Chlamydomonas incerta TaxID=51695 RepID=A0A835SCQ5_CHLIN|nr:hypothetical protein HXX76_014027 [Chlamydomonas incerta]|eukprot:KAG2424867.1 hypothetical protein HXX76_014027 [Chlamydomonas incerta]